MAKLSDETNYGKQESEKQKLQNQEAQNQQLQRDLADAISRLATLDEIRILLACGARVDNPVTQGLRPIHYAAYQNFIPAVRLLILRGCDINAMDDNGYTPVHLSAERGYYELLELLIANKAQVCFTDLKKLKGLNSMTDEPLSLALKRGNLDCAELLLKNGADPNARYFMGAEINLISILKVSSMKLLLDYGAQPDSRDRSGLTPLMKAARHPQGYATVKLLIDHGADVNDIAGERHDYRTVLHHSIFSGNLDLIRLLLTSGARYPRLDFDKPSPMDIAIISGRHDIAKLLIEFDADVNGGSNTTIGQPLHTALTQRVENKCALVRLLLDAGANANSCSTSIRNTGPPIHDYLHSVRQCANIAHPSANQANSSSQVGGVDLNIVHLLLMYGARVYLTKPDQHPFGVLDTLEKIQTELSLDLLLLLLEAAEMIDWKKMFHLIYSCWYHSNRANSYDLFDPSMATDMTPERLLSLLANKSNCSHEVSQKIHYLIDFAERSPKVLTLKHNCRIQIRQHLADNLKSRGRQFICRINQLPIPPTLRKYLVYQH